MRRSTCRLVPCALNLQAKFLKSIPSNAIDKHSNYLIVITELIPLIEWTCYFKRFQKFCLPCQKKLSTLILKPGRNFQCHNQWPQPARMVLLHWVITLEKLPQHQFGKHLSQWEIRLISHHVGSSDRILCRGCNLSGYFA